MSCRGVFEQGDGFPVDVDCLAFLHRAETYYDAVGGVDFRECLFHSVVRFTVL